MGVKKHIVRLTAEEREWLKALVSKGRTSARKIGHAQVLLKVDVDGPNWTDSEAAEAFGIRANTVRDIRQRFVEEGLEAALDRKRRAEPPTQRKLDGAGEARMIALACGEPPEGRARWTLRLLAGQMVELAIVDGISHETVRRTLKKRAEAAHEGVLVHPAVGERRVRRRDGRCPQTLCRAVRSGTARHLHG